MKKNVLLLFATLCVACGSVQKNDISAIDLIDHKFLELSDISLSDISESIRFIPLETNDSILVGRVLNVRLESDKLYVSDYNGIFVFDQNGKFLNTIGSKGRGPKEYISLYDFYPADEFVWLLDGSGKKALKFTDTGTFVTSVEFDPLQLYINYYSDGKDLFICFLPDHGQSDTDVMLAFYNTNGLMVDSVLHPKPIIPGGLRRFTIYSEAQFIQFRDQIKFKHVFNDTIYSIRNNKLHPNMVLHLGAGKANELARAEAMNQGVEYNIFQGMDVTNLKGESDRYLFLSVNNSNIYYDKKEQEIHKWMFTLPEDDRIDVEQSKKFVPMYIDKNGNLIGQTAPANEEDNPVIVIAILKN